MAIRAREKLIEVRAIQKEKAEINMNRNNAKKRMDTYKAGDIEAFDIAHGKLMDAERKYDATRDFAEAGRSVSKGLVELKQARSRDSLISGERNLKKVKVKYPIGFLGSRNKVKATRR